MNIVTRAILVAGDKVFLGKRARGSGAGQWALIGGKPEGGEAPAETICREVREERAIEFEPTPFSDTVDEESDPEGHTWRVYTFFGPFRGVPGPDTDEVSEVALVGEGDLGKYDIAFNHREVLKDFFASRCS